MRRKLSVISAALLLGACDVLSFRKRGNIVVRDLETSVIGGAYSPNTCSGIVFRCNNVGKEKFKNIYIVDNFVRGNGNEKNAMAIDRKMFS